VLYVRTVRTASGATAVQIVCSSHRGSRDIGHIGSSHDDAELELLKAAARQRWLPGRASLIWAWRLPGRAGRRRPDPGQAEPVRPAPRRHPRRQPRPRGQGPGTGRDQGLPHQPGRLPRRHPGHARVRDRCLPPAVPDREIVPDVQERPAGPARLPPQARLHRSPPADRVRRAGRQPLDRRAHRLAGPQIRPLRTARRYRTIEIQAGPRVITAARPCPATCARPSGPRSPARPRTPAASSPPDFVTRHCQPEQAGAPAPAAAAPHPSSPTPPRHAAGKHADGTHPSSTPEAAPRWNKPAAAARRTPRTSACPVS
jgi:hypothetical protein